MIGLECTRAEIDYTLPTPPQLRSLIERTEALLKELHEAMMQPMKIALEAAIADGKTNPFSTAEAMREPIFYGAESRIQLLSIPLEFLGSEEEIRTPNGCDKKDFQ